MNRHCPRPEASVSFAGSAGNGRADYAEYVGSLEFDGSSRSDRSSAEASESVVLKFMAAGLAHDINNMLHVSAGAVELIKSRIDRGQIEEVSDLSETALMALKRASAMAHDFLSFTLPMQVDSKRLCVSATAASMVPLLKCTLGDEIELKLTLTDGLPQIVCDRQQLERAILNLATNARDAMPFGGTLAITTFHADPAEEFPGPAHRQGAGIRAADTGEGMSPEVLQRAFDPFYTTKPRGTGLGFAIIKDFVELFRGKASATSVRGKGTTIELHFPAA
jgi:signal transduction histidine kinase